MIGLALATALAGCDLQAPYDAPFQQGLVEDLATVLLLEVWIDDAPPDFVREVASELEQRELQATFVTRALHTARDDAALRTRFGADPETPVPSLDQQSDLLAEIVDRGHPTGVAVDRTWLGLAHQADTVTALRIARRDHRRVAGTRPRTVFAPIPSASFEDLLRRAGFSSLVPMPGVPVALPHASAQQERQMGDGIVWPAGPYRDACGSDPRTARFDPAVADRVAVVLRDAGHVPPFPVTRLALTGGTPEDVAVFARWLDEVVLPAGTQVTSHDAVRGAGLRALRRARPDRTSGEPTGGGRLVTVPDVLRAATALGVADQVPPRLPGDLSPTEAWLAFVLVLARGVDTPSIRLDAIAPPAARAASTLSGPMSVSRAEVVGLASSLALALPDAIPSSLPVRGQLLNASELLGLFASAVRGEDPAVARPLPTAPGFGP